MANEMPDEVMRLVQVLIARSGRGELSWQAVGDQATGFVHTGRAGSVSIVSDDEDGRHPFTLALLTPEGVVGDSWTSYDRDTESMAPYWQETEDLYHAARRSASGSTTLIKDLLDEIDPDIPS